MMYIDVSSEGALEKSAPERQQPNEGKDVKDLRINLMVLYHKERSLSNGCKGFC